MIKLRFIQFFCMVIVLTVLGLGFCPPPVFAAEETARVPEEDVQVLASGPIPTPENCPVCNAVKEKFKP